MKTLLMSFLFGLIFFFCLAVCVGLLLLNLVFQVISGPLVSLWMTLVALWNAPTLIVNAMVANLPINRGKK